MKKNILIYLIIMFSCFFVFSTEVKAESCSWPDCCEYRLKAGLTKEIYIKLEFLNDFRAVRPTTTYGGEELETEMKYKGLKLRDLKEYSSCPEQVVFDDTSWGWKDQCDVYIVDFSKYDIDGQKVSLVKPATEDEKKSIDNNLQHHANTIEEKINNLKNKKCLDEETYDKESENYNLELVTECISLKEGLSNYAGSTNTEITNAKIDGVSDESKYPGLANLNKKNEEAKQIVSEIENSYGATGTTGDNDINIQTGDPMTCESLKDTATYKIVKQVFKWIQIIAPIMLVIFGVIDFATPVISGDNDAMKKAQSKFIKRVIIVAAIILLPLIIDLLISLLDGAMGNNVGTCEINK